ARARKKQPAPADSGTALDVACIAARVSSSSDQRGARLRATVAERHARSAGQATKLRARSAHALHAVHVGPRGGLTGTGDAAGPKRAWLASDRRRAPSELV